MDDYVVLWLLEFGPFRTRGWIYVAFTPKSHLISHKRHLEGHQITHISPAHFKVKAKMRRCIALPLLSFVGLVELELRLSKTSELFF